MTIKELIEKLKEFDPELEVGGIGHFGECLEIRDVYIQDRENFVGILTQWAGNEPD